MLEKKEEEWKTKEETEEKMRKAKKEWAGQLESQQISEEEVAVVELKEWKKKQKQREEEEKVVFELGGFRQFAILHRVVVRRFP